MLKRPYDYFTDYYSDKIKRDRKNNEFVFSQSDSLIAWIIGFAFSGLLLLIGNINALKLNLRTPTKPIIICILVTIVLGIAFRYVSFLIIMFEKGLDDYYFGRFNKHGLTPFIIDAEIENADFDSIIIHLKEDFGENIKYPSELSDDQKIKELSRLKEYYKKLCEHSRKEMDFTMKQISEIEYTTHRIDKQINKELFEKSLDNPKVGYNAKKWSLFRSTLFTLCLLSFLVGVSIVCFSLLLMN